MRITGVTFSPSAQVHIDYWSKNDPRILEKIFRLIESAMKNPNEGIGKPEKLVYELSGFWSRRITREHRLVYTVKDSHLFIIQARFHYE